MRFGALKANDRKRKAHGAKSRHGDRERHGDGEPGGQRDGERRRVERIAWKDGQGEGETNKQR
jgi:hypothetical protein